MSITKAMTGLLAFSVIDDGGFALDDPVVSVLPKFELSEPGASSEITFRHLLANTSGLPPFHFVDLGDGDDAVGRFVETFRDEETTFQPGSRFSYCNSGFNLVGAAIEAAVGSTFEAALQ